MSEMMTVEEMKSRFQSEWGLVGEPVEDDSLEVIRGLVLFHSPSAEATYRRALELCPGSFAAIFTGEIDSEDVGLFEAIRRGMKSDIVEREAVLMALGSSS